MSCRGFSNVGMDILELAKSIASTVIQDGNTKPICISDRTATATSPFCHYFYKEFSGGAELPTLTQVVHSVNISFPGAMENEFLTILTKLNDDGYKPDSFITFSEHVFNIINNVSIMYSMHIETKFILMIKLIVAHAQGILIK